MPVIKVEPAVVNVAPPSSTHETHVTVPDHIDVEIKHELECPQLDELIRTVRAAATDDRISGARYVEFVQQAAARIDQGLQDITGAIEKPRRAVYDKDGNPIGTESTETLDK